MPNYQKHLAGGVGAFIFAFLLISKSLNPSLMTSFQWFLICLIGSLFPDIDTKSKIQKLFYTALLMLFIVLYIYKQPELLIFISFLSLSPLIVNHRGLFHKPLFLLSLGIAVIFFTNMYFPIYLFKITTNVIFFIIGAFSHLWLDLGFKRAFLR